MCKVAQGGGIAVPSKDTVSYLYDNSGALASVIDSGSGKTTIYYYDCINRLAKYLEEANGLDHTVEYVYDANGNILSISDGTNIITYEYDVNNQLIREDDPIANTSRIFQFRLSGQLFLETYVPYTTGEVGWDGPLIGYNADSTEWEDLLTAVGDKTITSDDIGNMLSFDGYTYTWEHGRELATMADSAGTWAFTYDANGVRTKKVKTNTSGTVTDTYTYVYNGSQLSQMTKNGQTLNFFYDGAGRPAYFMIGVTAYYYVTNLQGDVVAILDSSGTVVVNYHYDAYGVLLQTGGAMATTLGTLNPLTYRGYVYDHEAGLYYLQSRYYNPEIKRFISADGQIAGIGGDVNGYDLYEYCFNNPVNMYDDAGTWPKWIERAAKIVTAAVAVTATVVMVATVSAVSCGTATPGALVGASMFLGAALSGINGGIANEKKGNSYINGYIGGSVGGTIQAACSKTPVGVIAGGGAGVFAGTIITDTLNNIDPYSKNSTANEVVTNAVLSAGKAFITSSLTAFMNYASDLAVNSRGNGLIQTFTVGFGEAVKSFFGWLDDALVYLLE